MRKTITIPDADVTQTFSFTGASLIVESATQYNQSSDYPVIQADNAGNEFPLYPRSQYLLNPAGFQKIRVRGTAASAGSQVTLITVDECLQTRIEVETNSAPSLRATINKATTDAVASFSDLELVNNAGLLPVAGTIQPKGDEVYFAFDVDPDVSAGKGFRLTETQTLRIEGTAFLQALRFINFTSATEVKLNLQLEY